MAYSEELDLIQNMKNISKSVDDILNSYTGIEPSIKEMEELKKEFTNLKNTTLDVIEKYDDTLNEKTKEMDELLEDCKSQFKQVTDDVESLVSLHVNFEEIKSKIDTCINLSNNVMKLFEGNIVLMNARIPISERVPHKRYFLVTGQS